MHVGGALSHDAMLVCGTYSHFAELYPDNIYPAAQRNVTVACTRCLFRFAGSTKSGVGIRSGHK